MSHWSQQYHDLWRSVRRSTDVDRLMEIDAAIHDSRVNGELDWREESLLRFCVLERLSRITSEDSESAISLILSRLIPYCIVHTDDIPDEFLRDVRDDRSRARELLREWIQYFDGPVQETMCTSVVDHLLPLLDTDKDGISACEILGQLGFGDRELFEELYRLGEAQTDRRKHYLYCLVNCGAPPSERLWQLVTAVHRGCDPGRLLDPLHRIEDSRRHALLLEVVRQLEAADSPHYLQFGLAVLAETTVTDSPGNTDALERVWEIAGRHEIMTLLDSRITPALDCQAVVPGIVGWLDTLTQIEDDAFRIWRIHHGLKRCHGALQLASWHNALQGRPLEVVLTQARMNAGESDLDRTMEADAKQFACHLLLMSGYPNTHDVLLEALVADKAWILQRSIAKLSCCLQISPLPNFVIERIEEERDENNLDSHEHAKRDAALSIALSNGTREAFDSLLNFGFTLRGSPLLSWTETLSYIAIELCRRRESGVLEALQQRLAAGQQTRHREAAARTFSFLGRADLLTEDVIPGLLKAVADEELPDYSRADVVSALHGFDCSAQSGAARAISTITFTTELQTLRLECAAFLIRQDLWSDSVDKFWKLIGWGEPDEIPASPEGHVDDWKCIIVVELFLRDPDRFADSLQFAINNCDDDVCFRLCQRLRRGIRFPETVVSSLLKRLTGAVKSFTWPVYLFAAVGHMEPKRLISDELWATRDTWIVEAKIGCIEALREACDQSELFDDERIGRLDILCGDSADDVRHAANQAIAALAPDVILKLWRARAGSEQPLWRNLLAAETVEFLPDAVRLDRSDQELASLKYHRFRQVRERVRASLTAAAQRDRAIHARDTLLVIKKGTNEEILQLYPYGDALANIGDLQDLRVLRDFLDDHQELQLNARAWIQDIIRQIAKRHESIDHEISQGWNAIFETFEGQLVSTENNYDATFHLWRQPGADYTTPGMWGGTAILTESLGLGAAFELDEGDIGALDREPAHVVITKVRGAVTNITGSGAYPSRTQS